MPRRYDSLLDGSTLHVGVIASRFNSVVTDRLLEGALETLRQNGVTDDAIEGDPFVKAFHKPLIEPSWLTWQAGLIPQFARLIYDERRFEEMPVLADALEDAGCSEDDLLSHCRHHPRHTRGCWVLDALLARE